MSIRIMTQAWTVDASAGDKLVLLALADWSNDEGACWPSIAKLVEKTGAGERTVQRALTALVEGGHITREMNPGKGCVYRVHPRQNDTPVKSTPVPKTTPTPAKLAPNTSRTTTTSEAKASSVDARRVDFEVFWKAYPRKVGKLDAERAWRRAKRPPLAELLAAVERYRRSKPADIDFCHPATWLNGGRWLDEHGETAGGTEAWSPDRWRRAYGLWTADGTWADAWGPRPGEPGCRVPANLLITESAA